MRFLIYGAGALGQAIGAMLLTDGHIVDLVLRKRYAEIIGRKGLNVTGIFGDYEAGADQLNLLTELTGVDGGPYDFVLITTKSYDTALAVEELQQLSGCDCPVVSMQNGCGNVEQLLEAFGPRRSFGGRVITGFEIERPGLVRITVSADAVHIGSAHLDPSDDQAEILAGAINDAGLPCIAVADIYQSLYAKLLYNCALNPLGAILGSHYGPLAEHPETRMIMNGVIDETFEVMEALGVRVPWENGEQYRDVFYNKLIPATYNHRPSMLQDLENKKPTEVDALVGYVSKQAKQYTISTPHCDLLAALIRFREKN